MGLLPKYAYERKGKEVIIIVSTEGMNWRDVAKRVRKIADCVVATDLEHTDARILALLGVKASEVPLSMSRQGQGKITRPRKKKPLPATAERFCSGCQQTKKIGEFQLRKQSLSGAATTHYHNQCKACNTERLVLRKRNEWLATLSNPELIVELNKAMTKVEHIRAEVSRRFGHAADIKNSGESSDAHRHPDQSDSDGCRD